MDTKLIQTKFGMLGARVQFRPMSSWTMRGTSLPISIDIGSDRFGEYFDIQAVPSAEIDVLDVQPRDRHLLLMVRRSGAKEFSKELKDKFLCGHDERHWFVAGIPEKAPASTVITAKEALKPQMVRDLEQGMRGKRAKFHKRKTPTFVRQGEWFFIPAPDLFVSEKLVLHSEPLRRGRGKPHVCQFLYRQGGQTVYVSRQYPNGLTETEMRQLFRSVPTAEKWNWRAMQRDPVVYVRGKVSHSDHATIRLEPWHRVAMNTESQSRAMAAVAFLD
jgi:hypothetical protein